MSEVLVWLGLVGLCIVERSLDDHIPAVPRAIDHQHVWFRHFNFLDFEALGQAAPKRMISMFYYSRAARTRDFPDRCTRTLHSQTNTSWGGISRLVFYRWNK